jgi:DNA-binding GntR family transcriptional regulator
MSETMEDGREPIAIVQSEYRTLQTIVTDYLRGEILGGRLGPGERVQHDDLARQLGVSRMPVREALRVLQSEGLIELRPHRGAIVVDLRPEEVGEIFEIRAMLEARAAELAAPRLTDETLAQLRGILEELGRTNDEERWLTLNTRFHTAIYPASGWPRLCLLIEQQRNVVQPYLRIAAAFLGRTESAHAEHEQILRAAEARDAERLAHLTVEHLRGTATDLIEYLKNRRNGGERRPTNGAADHGAGPG